METLGAIADRKLLLANRAFVYALLSRAFAEEPDDKFISIFLAQHTFDEIDLIEDRWSHDITNSYLQAAHVIAGREERFGTKEALAVLRDEYTKIFVGPNTLVACPWETMYTTGKHILFQEGVLEVRAAYREAGLLPAAYPHVADDFIALEVDFMAKLAQEACRAFDDGDEASCALRLSQSRNFAKEHLLKWIDSLAAAIEDNYPNCFYGAVARLTADYLKRDEDLIAEMMAEMRFGNEASSDA